MDIKIQEEITLHKKKAIPTGATVIVNFDTKDENVGKKAMTELVAVLKKFDQNFSNVT